MKNERRSVALVASTHLLQNFGPVGRSLSRLLSSGRHKDYLSVVLNPPGYGTDWEKFSRDYQAVSLLRKYPGLNTGVDTRAVALEKFLKCEIACGETNVRLRTDVGLTPGAWELVNRARSFIERCLGRFSWDAALQYCNFGPGANVGLPRRSSHLCKKIGNLKPTVTGLCAALLQSYEKYDSHVGDLGYDYEIVEGSSVTTVPKDARSDRVIAIEPLWNMFFQKGIGGMIRERLKTTGLDLNNGQPVNQELARAGSVDGRLATIDLSSASDTICHRLVELLLPEDWYNAMMVVRSPTSLMPDGKRVVLRKFSSMGNGFTFELESLIFWSLVRAVYSSGRPGLDVTVYGDDIVAPVDQIEVLVSLLSELGFTTNKEKSFTSGPFRESCGMHYFLGRDVTPFFIKKEIRTVFDRFWLANSLRRGAYRLLGLNYGLDGRYKDAWDFVVSSIPQRYRTCLCPEGYGDDALVVDFDEAVPTYAKSSARGWEGYVSDAVAKRVRERSHNGLPALISKLWYTRRGLDLGEASQLCLIEMQHDESRVYKTKRHYPLWTTLGPWVMSL